MSADLDENSARVVTLARAVETTDTGRVLASDAERAQATRMAGEALGATAAPVAFLVHRARGLLERIGPAHPALLRVADAFAWRGWLTPAVLAAAALTGVAIDELGSSGRIDLLAPPLLGLLAWNGAVYLAIAGSAVARVRRHGAAAPGAAAPGPVQHLVSALGRRGAARAGAAGPELAAIDSFTRLWVAQSAPLHAARATRVLHLAAAALACGVLAGLYLRGLAFEYRASWSSTFLDAAQVRALLAALLAPASAVTGIAVPDAAHLATLRAGATPGSENAAPWLHLYAATLVLWVIGPRLVLAALAGWTERRRAARIDLGLADPYYRRLLRALDHGPAHVAVLPYSFAPPPASAERLATLLARVIGECSVRMLAPAAYGGDVDPDRLLPNDATCAVALFNAAATPEAETHGAFAMALSRGAARDALAVVDEAALHARWPDEPDRLAQRRAAWREVLHASRLAVAFVDLSAPDLAPAEAALNAGLSA